MLLARLPRPLGGRISGDRGDGDLLGERGHGIVDMCSTAAYRLFLLLPEVLVAKVVVAETEVEVDVEGVRMRERPLRLPPLPPERNWNLETIVETRLRKDRDMEEDWELDEMVEGECLREGASLRASRVGRGAERGKVRIKE